MTYEECIAWIVSQPRWAWSAPWWRTSEIIVSAGERAWSVKDPTSLVPIGVALLGCTAFDSAGRAAWVGWDLDVGEHGTTSYPTTEDAVQDALRLREELDGRAEVRLSKSGLGVHVKTLLYPAEVLACEGPKIARSLASKLNLRADATPLGRQAFWMWARVPAPRAFTLIEEHKGLNG